MHGEVLTRWQNWLAPTRTSSFLKGPKNLSRCATWNGLSAAIAGVSNLLGRGARSKPWFGSNIMLDQAQPGLRVLTLNEIRCEHTVPSLLATCIDAASYVNIGAAMCCPQKRDDSNPSCDTRLANLISRDLFTR